jgi:hypothetical protein
MKKLTTEEFIRKAKEVHGDLYDYSMVIYKGCREEVTIRCSKHGEFTTRPLYHLKGRKCRACATIISSHNRLSVEEFVNRSKKIHNNKYDYSEVVYVNNSTKVDICCPDHGIFSQLPSSHLSGNGCASCFGNKRSNKENFVKSSMKIHGEKYDYTKTEYKGRHNKVKIRCKKHGEFEQEAGSHLQGVGCPQCFGENQMVGTRESEHFIPYLKSLLSQYHI